MYHLAGDRPIVQKYGGTSVGTVERIQHVADRIAAQYQKGFRKIAVVVSAMPDEMRRLVDLVTATHSETSLRNFDMAVAAGEQVAVALMAAALEKAAVPSHGFLAHQLGIVTSSLYSKARIHDIDCKKLHECWEAGMIPVVAGFQGRGGCDASAVTLAVALDAAFCEINTDGDGVFTADPHVVPAAHLITEMDFEVALEMASLGSKVLHGRCVELGARYQMPIVVRNTFQPDDHQRTIIMSFNAQRKLEAPEVSGVTLDRNVVRLSLSQLPLRHGMIARLFEKIAASGVNVDIIVHDKSEQADALRIGFTIGAADLVRTQDMLQRWSEEQGSAVRLEAERGLAKVSVVGLGMQSHPGVASKVFTVLEDAGIAIQMISTSEIKMSCVVLEADGDRAAQALHRAFIEDDKV